MDELSHVKLSICIGTYNRADLIALTLDTIVSQATDECEIVVVDNASTDQTPHVLSDYARRFHCLRYFRQESNKGLDRNFDCAVELARGEYCWLFPDDDWMKAGAIEHVIDVLHQQYSLILVNTEIRDATMAKLLQPRSLNFESDRIYCEGTKDDLLLEIGTGLMYIGNVVIQRSVWLARDRERFYGSLLVHVGVILQEPLPGKVLVIAKPLIVYRWGNSHSHSATDSEITLVKWPSLVESLVPAESMIRRVGGAQPWRSLYGLMIMRGLGLYSLDEYRRSIRPRVRSLCGRLSRALIASLPGVLINAIFVFCYSFRSDRAFALHLMQESRFHRPYLRFFQTKLRTLLLWSGNEDVS